MSTVTVYARRGFTGEVVGEMFRDGVAEVAEGHDAQLAYFRRRSDLYSIGEPAVESPPAPPADDAEPQGDPKPVDEPPKAGPGSGLEEWRAYARTLGVDPGDQSRAELIATVEAGRSGEE